MYSYCLVPLIVHHGADNGAERSRHFDIPLLMNGSAVWVDFWIGPQIQRLAAQCAGDFRETGTTHDNLLLVGSAES